MNAVMKRAEALRALGLAQIDAQPTDAAPDFPQWVTALRDWRPGSGEAPTLPEMVHAVRGLILAGKVGALVAAGGTGKTTLLLILLICHALGRPFFGMEVLQGTFVLLSNDDPQEDLQRALELVMEAMLLSPEERSTVRRTARLVSLQGQKGTKTFTATVGGAVMATDFPELLLEGLKGIPDLVGVAIDTLRQFSGGNSNDEQVVTKTIAGATEIAQQTGAYVVVCHHTGKQNFRDGVADQYCGSGSAAIADNSRFILLLQTTTWADIESKVTRTGQEHGDPLVLLSTRGSLLMKPPEPVFLHRKGYFIGRVAGAVKTTAQQIDERDRKVLQAVRDGHQSKNAIVAAIGGKKQLVLSRINELETRGHLINSSPNGSQTRPVFQLSASGSRFLEASE